MQYIFILLCLLGAGYGSIIAFSQPGVKNAFANATSRQPESFTEIYFENHSNLPKKFNLNKELSFSFTIHNLTGKDMQYPYEVYFDVAGERLSLDQKTVFIKNNGYKTIQEKFTPTVLFPDAKAIVNLTNNNEQIDFLLKGNIILP